MRMTFALPLLALGLAACQTYAGPYQGPYGYPEPIPLPDPPVGQGDYRAIGTEPFWDLTVGRDLVFTDRGTNVSVVESAPPPSGITSGELHQGRRLRVKIVPSQCSDGMSDRTYPDTVTVTVDGRAYSGCGANAAFYARVGEDGRDRARSQPDLASLIVGRWIAASFDGRPAAVGDRFALVVTPTEVRTEGVCNNLRGHYRIAAGKLSPDGPPWPRTERGCDPDRMVLEDRVYAVMWHQPVVSFPAPGRLRLSSVRGSIEMTRAH